MCSHPCLSFRVPLSFVAPVSVSRSLAIAVPSVALSTHQLIGHEPKLALVKELRRVVDGTFSVRVCRRGSRGVEQAAGRQGTRPASEVVSEVVQEHDSDCCIGRALQVESKALYVRKASVLGATKISFPINQFVLLLELVFHAMTRKRVGAPRH